MAFQKIGKFLKLPPSKRSRGFEDEIREFLRNEISSEDFKLKVIGKEVVLHSLNFEILNEVFSKKENLLAKLRTRFKRKAPSKISFRKL